MLILRYAMIVFVRAGVIQPAESHNGVLRGKIVESQTKTPLAGANVFIQGTTRGGSADTCGVFIIPGIPTGKYVITASSVGYIKQRRTVVISTDTSSVTFQRAVDVLTFGEITTTAERTDHEGGA